MYVYNYSILKMKNTFLFYFKAWLSSSNWDNISELNKLPGFLGVEKSFEQFSREWKQWYMSSNPESLKLIGEY